MNRNLKAWASGIALAGFLAAGCASTAESGKSWARLPSPWTTVKKSATPDSGERPSMLSKLSLGKSKTKTDADEALTAALLRGRNHERAGEWDKAREVYEAARQVDPERAELAHRLGVVADVQRRHGEAEALFQFALARDPQNATVLSDLGYCYFLQGQLSKAESALIKATRLEPANGRHSNNLGLVMGHQGRHKEALACFRNSGSEADAQYNLAFIYAAQERAEQAKACFELALAADPLHRRAREALTSFEQYERLPAHLRELHDVADNGVRYVPFVEDAGGVQQARAGVATSLSANRATRALHTESRGMLNRNMASERADDMAAP
jgi:tetratricopeptide (TPR) repeat protein